MSVLRLNRTMKALGALLGATLAIAAAHAQEAPYPSRPITLMVPFAAGGGTDILARLVATGMSARLGQPIVVDNRPGRNTGIAASAVARAKPDGYTLLLGNSSTYVVNTLLNVKTSYTPDELAVLGMVANFPMVYVVANNSPIKSVDDLVAAAKKSPGQLAYASPGAGSPHHLGMESLKHRAGLEMVHVPYKGVSPAFPDILAGRVAVMFTDYAAATGLVKDGKLRPLAVGSSEPSSFLPGVPTMQSLGYKGFQFTGWQGMAVPAGTPPAVVNKLVAALRDTLADPETRKRLNDTGLEANFMDPIAFTQHLAREREQLGALIKSNKITVE
jgi:tripartite-type tricarboxylate transporter receptor subunit TctC